MLFFICGMECSISFVQSFIPSIYAIFRRYGNPGVDGQWQHWNHEILPHWNSNEAGKFPSKLRFDPPDEIHSPFYPARGCYSSRDLNVTRAQFQELLRAGVGVVVLSWSGRPDVPGTHDTQGISTDGLLEGVLDVALEVHVQPFDFACPMSVLSVCPICLPESPPTSFYRTIGPCYGFDSSGDELESRCSRTPSTSTHTHSHSTTHARTHARIPTCARTRARAHARVHTR